MNSDTSPTDPVPTSSPLDPADPATSTDPGAPHAGTPAGAPPNRSRRWWLVGGAAAGVLLLTGGVAAGVLLGRTETTVVVNRSVVAGTTSDGNGTDSGSTGTTDGSTSGTSSTTTVPDWAVTWVDADDIELSGDTLTAASAAALDAAGTEAVVTSAELSDDPTHTYEIEVTRQDGAEMDVYLDADFGVVATGSWHS